MTNEYIGIMEKYNGWHNWDTWNLNLWLLHNDENTFLYIMESSDVDDLIKRAKNIDVGDEIDWAKINWQELYNSIFHPAK